MIARRAVTAAVEEEAPCSAARLTSPSPNPYRAARRAAPRQDAREAMRRLGPEIEIERNQRIKRALDLSMKHVDLDPELQKLQTPFASYMEKMLDQVKDEYAEREALGTSKPYNRQLP